MDKICYKPIGVIYSPFKSPRGTPIQPTAATGVEGRVEVFDQFKEGLQDLEDFSHIIIIYHFHLMKKCLLTVKPFLDNAMHGVFATRAPSRPNFIGLSVVRLMNLSDKTLHVKDIDVVNGTPLLDVKPYVPQFDKRETNEIGWLGSNVRQLRDKKDDARFI